MTTRSNYGSRTTRAARILENDGVQIHNLVDRTFDVASERNPDQIYRVNLKHQTCDCADARPLYNAYHQLIRNGNVCKHIIAATTFERHINESKARPTPTTYAALFAKLAPAPTSEAAQ